MPPVTVPDPRVVVFADTAESAGKIKAVLEAYAVPAVPALATLGDLRARLALLLKRHPSIKLVVLSLQGYGDPARPIEIIKRHSLPIIALAPLQKNSHSLPLDFSTLRVTGFQWQQSDNLRNVAMAARNILKITTPVTEKAISKEPSGGVSKGQRTDLSRAFRLGDDGGGQSEEIDFGIALKKGPSAADLAE